MNAGRTVSSLRPRDVEGYADARLAGVLPPVSEHAPTLLPGPTAQHEFRRFLARSAGAIAIYVAAFTIAGKVDGIARAIMLLVPGLLCFWLIVFRFLSPVGRRSEEELSAGYTTLVLQFGALRTGGWRWQHLPWDYRGTWALDDCGAALTRPDPALDSPGYYPSPNRKGSYELWTGATWAGLFRER
jgi:hypothetical protein